MAKNIRQARGIVRHPYFNRPDTKFDTEGVFKCDLIMSADAAAPLLKGFGKMQQAEMAKVQKKLKGKKAVAADLPIRPDLDDNGEETGNYFLRVKTKASGVARETGERYVRKLKLFDAQGNPTDAQVGGGSEVIIAYEAKPWSNAKGECSVTCYLEAVQVITLVEGGQATASRYGFGAVEGGYSEEGGMPGSADDDEPPFDADESPDEEEYDF